MKQKKEMKQQLDPKIDEVIKKVKEMNGKSNDIVDRKIKIGSTYVAYMFLESVSSDDKISDFLMRSLSNDIKYKEETSFDTLFDNLKNTIPNSKVNTIKTYDEFFYHLASGFVCLIVDGTSEAMVFETKSQLDRGVTESSSEAVIRGPKDSFTENHMMNVGLIRKRIKDPKLWIQESIVGRRTKTKVSVAYIQDIADLTKVEQIKKKIEEIDIDGVLDSGYIREFLETQDKSAFPKMISTERPDLACESLLDGKIVILVENSPFVLIMPGVLMDFFHNPEDNYQKPINVSFTRILRITAFLLTILTPSLYIAITTFNQEIIPDKLLISLAIQREGVPFPTAMEVLILSITFEILRESDIRIPSMTGTAISVVGALVLGEAAVNAGIISPIVVIIVAITSICGLLFSDIDVINAIRWWRLLFMLFSAIMGIVGFLLAGIIFITKLASLQSLGTPYLAPMAPFYKNAQKDALIRVPRNKLEKRPGYISKKNPHRLGGKKHEA